MIVFFVLEHLVENAIIFFQTILVLLNKHVLRYTVTGYVMVMRFSAEKAIKYKTINFYVNFRTQF